MPRAAAPALGALQPGPRELELRVRPLDGRQRQRDDARIGIVHRDRPVSGGFEDAVELPAAGDGVMGPHPDALADGAREVLGAYQRPVETGGRALQVVPSRDRVVRIEDIAQLARDSRQLVERDTTGGAGRRRALGTIEQQSQDQPPSFGPVLHVDELEPRPKGEGLGQLPDALGHRGPIHRIFTPYKMKKWAEAHFCRSVKPGNLHRITRGSWSRNALLHHRNLLLAPPRSTR